MRSKELHKHHFISAKEKKRRNKTQVKRVGMKVHRYIPSCTLVNDFAILRSLIKAKKIK